MTAFGDDAAVRRPGSLHAMRSIQSYKFKLSSQAFFLVAVHHDSSIVIIQYD